MAKARLDFHLTIMSNTVIDQVHCQRLIELVLTRALLENKITAVVTANVK